MPLIRFLLPFLFIPLLLMPGPGEAQDRPPLAGTGSSSLCPAEVPFGVGERMDYRVRLGPLRVGEASVEVEGLETVRGHLTYRLDWRLQGGIPFYRVDDHYTSWMDVRTLASRRFIQDIHQGRRERLRHFEIYPELVRYEWVDQEEELDLISDHPLDEIAFVFFVRTLPLEIGETLTFNKYFREHGNPVTLEVLRREEVEVPAGTFQALVLRPIIKSRGLWDEDSEAEIYVTDDDERVLLKVRSRVPVIGSLTLLLTHHERGVPLVRRC